MTLNGRTLLMGFVVLAVMLVSASIIIDQADDSDAATTPTIEAGQTKTFTYTQMGINQTQYNSWYNGTADRTSSCAVQYVYVPSSVTSTSADRFADLKVEGISSTSVSVSCPDNIRPGTYTIHWSEWLEELQEDNDLFTSSIKVTNDHDGSSSSAPLKSIDWTAVWLYNLDSFTNTLYIEQGASVYLKANIASTGTYNVASGKGITASKSGSYVTFSGNISGDCTLSMSYGSKSWSIILKTVSSSGGSTTTNYTVTFSANPSTYGSVNKSSITVASGTTYSASGNKITFSDGQSVTATAASSTSSYTYSFDGWSSSTGTITSAKTIKANFSQTAVTTTTYTVKVYKGDWDSFYWYHGDDTKEYTGTYHTYTVKAGEELDIDWYSSNTSGSGSGTGYTYTWSSDSECQDMATSNGGTSKGNSVTIDSSGLRYYPATTKESTKTYTYTYNYTITYNANGGTGAPSNTTATSTSNSYSTSTTKTIALSSTTPTRSSTSGTGYTTAYTFLGWSTSSTADSADYQPGKSYSFSYGTTSLYAVWKETKTYSFTITYDANTGTGAPNSTNGGTSNSSSKTITLSPTIPTKSSVNGDSYTTSYTFLGWAETSTAKSAAYEAGKSYSFSYGTTPLYAVWSQTTTYSFTVQYDVNGGSGTISDTTGSGNSSSKQLTLSSVKPTKANTTGTNTETSYTFLGWSTDSKATKADYQSGNAYSFNYGTTKLYAVYSPTVTYQYTIQYNTNGGSSVPNTTDSSTATSKEVTLTNTVPTKSGKTFLGWADSSTATTPDYQKGGKLTMNYGSKTVYAVWKNAILEFSVDIDDRNINQGQTRTIAISENSGESVTITVSGATWATYSNGYITLNPTTSDAPGTYHITVEMSKDGYSTITQTFDVTVKSKLSFGSPTVGVIAYAL